MRPTDMSFSWRFRRGATVVVVVALLLLLSFTILSSAEPTAAQQRPTLTFTPAGDTSSGTGPSASGLSECQSICGQVINLEANSGEAGQTVRFGGVGLETTTDANGNYAFGRLGQDVGFLNVIIPEESDLRAATENIPLAPIPGQIIIANLGVYRDRQVAPLLAPSVRAEPGWVRPGQQVTFTVQVENSLPNKISGVMVTDLLPEGLLLAGVTSDHGDVYQRGNYGAAFIGDLASGEAATVAFIADVGADAASGTRTNQVSLAYREHAAAQAVTTVGIGRAAPTAVPANAAPPTATSAPAATTSTVAPTRTSATASATLPSTGPTFLPQTGSGLAVLGIGLTLGATALTARCIRKRRE